MKGHRGYVTSSLGEKDAMGRTGQFTLRCLLMGVLVGLGRDSSAQEGVAHAELAKGWELVSAHDTRSTGAEISAAAFEPKGWLPVFQMPATVLQVLEDDGVYPNLYFGMNLLTELPQDLYQQDWWYRTSFEVPGNKKTYWLELPGINYRAELWINGKLIADSRQLDGMYVSHTFNITDSVQVGKRNAMAIKVTPERAIPDVSGVELADSWHDWLDWKYLGSRAPRSDHYKEGWTADRNAGVWKPVYLRATGAVRVSDAFVSSKLPLPATDSARLSVYATVTNGTAAAVSGTLSAEISRAGKPTLHLETLVSLGGGETREVVFSAERFPELNVQHPDLWWPYTMGEPNLYDLKVEFRAGAEISDAESLQFGVREVTQHRDSDLRFSRTHEGNFYLKVNGKDFLARGADYTPDLLFREDRQRNADNILYVKDLGLNMLRWEAKIADEDMFARADRAGIPVMVGWMCCSKWEQWSQWSAEDQEIARQSLRSQILMLRAHSSAFIWSNGSDGRPPEPLLSAYRSILAELHWPNVVVDTDANGNRDAQGHQLWDGIGMFGVDRWHPPSYWFDHRYPGAGGSSAEYGDNEVIPTFSSLKKFIPEEKLWPINEAWFFHAGAHDRANELTTIRTVVERRYGPSLSAKEFADKAQLAHYETTRAQFEAWSSDGWATHKMEMYWMLNNHWPSFFGHLYDYYMEPGGGYFGAKKALRPLSVVFDYYAARPHKSARIRVTNQTMGEQHGLAVRVRIYDLEGKVQYDRQAANIRVAAQGVAIPFEMPRPKKITSTYFVRCELFDSRGEPLVDNVYWQSTQRDDFGNPLHDDDDYPYTQASWSSFLELNKMAKVELSVSGSIDAGSGRRHFSVALHNGSGHIAFFNRVTVSAGEGGDEVLPILYDDNYVSVFPGETKYVLGSLDAGALGKSQAWMRVEGYTTKTSGAALKLRPSGAEEQRRQDAD